MNKRIIISIALVVLLVLSLVAVMMISRGTNEKKPNGTGDQITGGAEDASAVFDTEGTGNAPGTDGTGNTPDSTENDEDNAEKPTVSMGVVDGAGSRDPDEDDSNVSDKPTNPNNPTNPSQPVETTPQDNNPLPEDFDIDSLTYEGYERMTGAQQKAVIDLFATPEDFVKWHNAMAAQYKAEHPEAEIGPDGKVELLP